MKRAILCLVLALLLCLPGFANTSSTGYTWEQYKAKKAGQTLVPTEGQKSVKRGTYQSSVTSALPDQGEPVTEQPQWLISANHWCSISLRWLANHRYFSVSCFLCIAFLSALPSLSKRHKLRKQVKAEQQLIDAERRAFELEEYRRLREIQQRLVKHPYELERLPIEPGEEVVYVTWSGLKYHKETCGVIKSHGYIAHKISLSCALYHGFSPCSRCCPDMPEPELKRDTYNRR